MSVVPGPRRVWIVAALVLAAALPYLRTLGHELVWDDLYIVADVEEAHRAGGTAEVLKTPFLRAQNALASYYRPWVHLSFLADARAGGGSAWPYHLTNLLLHVTATLLVFALIGILLGDHVAAAAGGVLFAVLPVHVETVAFVAGRTDLWAAVFALTALVAWRKARTSGAGPARRTLLWTLAAAACFAGCLAKEVVYLLPALVAVWSLLLPAGRPLRDAAPFVAAIVAAAGVRGWAIGFSLGGAAEAALLTTDPALAAKGLLSMLRRLAVPWPHNALITREYVDLGVATLLVALPLLAVFTLPLRVPGLRIAWMGGVLGAFSLVPVLAVPSNSIVVIAERYLYLPSVALALVVGAGFARWWQAKRGVAAAAGIAVVAALGVATHQRAGVWRDDPTLAEDFVRTSPASAYAWDLLGQARLKQRRWDEALSSFDRAVTLAPNDAGYHNDAGIALRRLGRPDLAVVAFRKSLELDPGAAGTRLNLAYACISLGDVVCVEDQRRALAAIDPGALDDLEAVLAGGRQERAR